MDPTPALPASRTTAFVNGDEFIAMQTAQGMVAGKRYIVIDKNERATVFGTFVTYFVNEVAVGTPFWVKDLHLVATAERAPEDAVYCEKCGADCTVMAERGDPCCPGCGDPEPWDPDVPANANRQSPVLPATADELLAFIAKEIEPALAKALNAANAASHAYEQQPTVRDGFTGNRPPRTRSRRSTTS